MTGQLWRTRTGIGALLTCLSAVLLLSGCSLFHRHRTGAGCQERPFSGNAENLAPLKAPPGLDAPDTHEQIKIPQLNEPEQVRSRTASCLDQPPRYVSAPPQPPVRRPTQ